MLGLEVEATKSLDVIRKEAAEDAAMDMIGEEKKTVAPLDWSAQKHFLREIGWARGG
jgi:hypothetical protein